MLYQSGIGALPEAKISIMGEETHAIEETHDMHPSIAFSSVLFLKLRYFVLRGIWLRCYFSGIGSLPIWRI